MASVEIDSRLEGALACAFEFQPQWKLAFGDGLPLGQRAVTFAEGMETAVAIQEPVVKTELRHLRSAIRSLLISKDPLDMEQVKDINEQFVADTWLVEAETPLVTAKDIVKKLGRANNTQLLEFLRWNVERNREHSQALQRDLPLLQEEALERVRNLVGLGFYPVQTISLYAKAISKSNPVALDSFEAGGMRAAGFLDDENFNLGLANLYNFSWDFTDPTRQMRSTLFHEDTHATGALRRGFFRGILPAKGGMMRWLEEPFVSHATQVAMNPNHPMPEVLEWCDRLDKTTGSYPMERDLLKCLSDGQEGSAFIPTDLLAAAFFSPRAGMSKLRQEVHRKLSKSIKTNFPQFADNPLYLLSQAYETTPERKREKLVDGWLDQIYRRRGVEIVTLTIDDPTIISTIISYAADKPALEPNPRP